MASEKSSFRDMIGFYSYNTELIISSGSDAE